MSEQRFKEWFALVFNDLVRAVVRATGATLEEVEDAAQDVLVHMIQTWDRYDDRVTDDPDSRRVTIRRRDGQTGDTLFVYLRRAIVRQVFRNRMRHTQLDPGPIDENEFSDLDKDEMHHRAGRRSVGFGGLEPVDPTDVPEDVARRELNDRYRGCIKGLSDPHRDYLINRFCVDSFRLPPGGRRLPPALDALRRCLMRAQVAFEELIELCEEWLIILCGEFCRVDLDITPIGGI